MRGARIGKAFAQCKKGSAEKIMGEIFLEEVPEAWGSTGKSKEKVSFGAEKSDVPSKKCPKSAPKRGKTRKKWTSQGKKRARSLKKTPELGPKMGKSAKNGDFGAKKMGWGRGEKMGFTADFAML